MMVDDYRNRGESGSREPLDHLRVLLVDDHPVYRHGMRTLLSTLPDTEVVGEAKTGDEAMVLAERLHPDVVIMDLQLPGMNGIEATRRIKLQNPHIGVLVMTMFQDDQSVCGAIRAGAQGYVLKDADEEEILRAVRAVGHGQAIFNPDTAPRLLSRVIPFVREEGACCSTGTLPSAPGNGLSAQRVVRDQGIAARRGRAGSVGNEGDRPEDRVEATASCIRTFLVADIRGYTRFTQERGDEAAAQLTLRFAQLTEEVVASWEGQVVETRGDEVLVAFTSARSALRAAVALQARLTSAQASDPSLCLRVGVGLDAGEAIPVGGGYRGGSLNLAARLCSIAGPGEVFCSEAVIHLARKTEGITGVDRGEVILKGLSTPVRVIQVALEETEIAGPATLSALDPVHSSWPTSSLRGIVTRHQAAQNEEVADDTREHRAQVTQERHSMRCFTHISRTRSHQCVPSPARPSLSGARLSVPRGE